MLSTDHAKARSELVGHPALTDAETGLANRLHFELVYGYLFAAGDRGLAFTVMMMASGASGDLVAELGRAVRGSTRSSDLVSHVGGGRYVVLLLGTNVQGARIAADRVELAVADTALGAVSFGLAAYHTRMEDSIELLESAETALQAAEAAGGGVEFGA